MKGEKSLRSSGLSSCQTRLTLPTVPHTLNCLSVCLSVHSPHVSAGAFRDQRRWISLELEFQFVSSLMLLLRVPLGLLQELRWVSLSKSKAIHLSSSHFLSFFFLNKEYKFHLKSEICYSSQRRIASSNSIISNVSNGTWQVPKHPLQCCAVEPDTHGPPKHGEGHVQCTGIQDPSP